MKSLVPILPDMWCDSNLNSASILCFNETWLNPSQPSPVLLNGWINIRYKRIICANREGVVNCVHSHMNTCGVQRFATHGIEAVSAIVQPPNMNHGIQLALVYRSPNESHMSLFAILTRLLPSISPCNYSFAWKCIHLNLLGLWRHTINDCKWHQSDRGKTFTLCTV